jgi:hypothetical protein
MTHREPQQEPPVSTTVTTSPSTCSLSGEPPFKAITEYECTASKPIWALVRLFTDFSGGIEIRDPLRKHRRIGGVSSIVADEWDEDALDLEDTELVRLEPGQKFSTSYTISVVPKADGLRDSDIRHMVPGNTYEITLRKQRWRWMFEDDMPEDIGEDERRAILKKTEVVEWKVDSQVNFTAT